jgi:cobalt/nickel transport system permease protein
MSHRIDALAHGNRLRLLPPLHKACFAATMLVLALVAPVPVQVLIGLWLALWVVGYAGIPAGTYLAMLLLPLGFAVSSLPAIVISAAGQDGPAGMQADAWRGLSLPAAGWTLYISNHGLSQASACSPVRWRPPAPCSSCCSPPRSVNGSRCCADSACHRCCWS